MESANNSGIEDEAPKDNGHAQGQSNGGGGPEAEASASTSPQMHNMEESLLPLPVWMRESSKTFHWRWVPVRIRQASRSVVRWTKGPDPPQIQKITPFFPEIQQAPVRLIDEYLPKPKYKALLLALFYCCWVLVFSLVLVYSNSAGTIKGFGKPTPVWCGASYWLGVVLFEV